MQMFSRGGPIANREGKKTLTGQHFHRDVGAFVSVREQMAIRLLEQAQSRGHDDKHLRVDDTKLQRAVNQSPEDKSGQTQSGIAVSDS
jgi:hypothetical protein